MNRHRLILLFILIISVLALVAAFTAEFKYHITPCLLCLAQRVPFVLAIVVALFGLMQPLYAQTVFSILAALFFVNVGIAAYQVGIEHQWWGVDAAGNGEVCSAQNLTVENIKDLYQSMSGTPVGDCAHPAFNFHGITFAVLNSLLSLLLFLAVVRFRFGRR